MFSSYSNEPDISQQNILTTREKLKLLIWKNWCVHWNNRKSLLVAILAPTFFCVLLVMVRLLVDVKVFPVTEYSAIDLNKQWRFLIRKLIQRREEIDTLVEDFEGNSYIPNLTIGYAPNVYLAFNKTMEKVAQDYIKILPIVGFQTCEALRENMLKNNYFAGVCFSNKTMLMHPSDTIYLIDDLYPNRLSYALYFPNELRIYSDRFIGVTWNTVQYYELSAKSHYRITSKAKDGGYVGYIREGFASLQHFISMSYIRTISKNDELPAVSMQRFPHRSYYYDKLNENLDTNFLMFIFIGYILPVAHFTKNMIYEKESKLRAKMKAAGISNWLHFTSWLIIGFIFMIISSILVLIILKIHFHNGHAICTKSSWTALFFVLCVYSIVTISFCIMMSSFNKITIKGTVIAIVVWVVTFLPYQLKVHDPSYKMMRIVLSIFSNTAMGFAISNILEDERYSNGFQWNLMFTSGANKVFSVGTYLFIMLAVSIIYFCIALYIEAASLCFICSRCHFWGQPQLNSTPTSTRTTKRMSKVYEVEPEYKKLIVSIKNLTKTYDEKSVVNDVSMNLYKNEITVLIGHNGSGKSKLFSMLVGLEKPTSGKILINGIDMQHFPEYICESIGTCMFNGILFDEFTVIDQLVFFSRLRGMSKTDSYFEAERFIRAMNLETYIFTLTRNLTIGVRQQLATCCAFVGNSEIVLLDEPATSMDIASRRALWELVNAEKMGRTILMSSQFVNEAEIFADCIGVMSGGELKCFGTPFFLKKFYGHGYHLTFRTTDFCNVDAITEIIGNQIPRVKPEFNIGCDLGYTIEERNVHLLGDVFDKLEAQATELGLESISISDTSLKDIFLKMGAQNSHDGDRHHHLNIMAGKTIFEKEYENPAFLQSYEKITGTNLLFTQWKAMLKKRLIYNLRYKMETITQPILLLMLLAATCITLAPAERKYLSVLRYELTMYPSSVTVIASQPMTKRLSILDDAEENYRKQLVWLGIDHKLEDTNGEMFGEHILDKKNIMEVYRNYHVGVTFANGSITAWFNNYPIHTVPLSLNMVHNALLRALLNDDALLRVKFEPLDTPSGLDKKDMNSPFRIGNILAFNITIGFGLVFSVATIFTVNERLSGFKFMQIISGLPNSIYWLTTISGDIIRLLILSTAVAVTLAVYELYDLGHVNVSMAYFATLIISGFSMMSYNYLLQLFFKDLTNAYSVITVFNMTGCVCYCALYDIFLKAYYEGFHKEDIIAWPFLIFPHFNLCKALVKCFYISAMQDACEDKDVFLVSVNLEKCNSTPNCCLDYAIWSWDTGILPELLVLTIKSSFIWTLFIIHECDVLHKIKYFKRQRNRDNVSGLKLHMRRHSDNPEVATNHNILQERVRVLTLKPREYFNKPLICNAVEKFYNDKSIITKLYLILERSECLCLLGINGSGKSTLIKLLVGAEKITCGDVVIDGIKINEHFDQICSHVGYCPQKGGVMPDYTGKELMDIFGALRGIPSKHIGEMSENLAKMLGFYPHYNKRISAYTTGHKKRLKCAIAILSCPSLICIDEATSYIDPAGRRQLMFLFNMLINQGKSVIISTLLPHEAPRYCTRVALISNGSLSLLGSPTHIDEKDSRAYFLTVKIRPRARFGSEGRFNHMDPFMKLQVFVENEFPQSQLHDQCCNVLEFMIPKNQTTTLALIFYKMENQISNLNIEFITIADASLATLFIHLGEEQFKKEM